MSKFFKIALLGLYLAGVLNSDAIAQQQDRFVYIQSDDKLPFDVIVDGKTYNASSIGYVIIPKLVKGTYQFNISFPNKKYPDQQFNCVIDKADEGFALKNYGDKGWGLYNLQSLEISMAGGAPSTAPGQSVAAENSGAFGNMLSEVVDDSTLNKKFEPVKVEKPAVAVDSVKQDITTNAGQALDSSVTLLPAFNKLQKITEVGSSEGTDMVFVDTTGGLHDTIRIFLPAMPAAADSKSAVANVPAPEVKQPDSAATSEASPVNNPVSDTAGKAPGEVANPFYKKEIEQPVTAKEDVVEKLKEERVTERQPVTAKPDCTNMLSENDMDKLRKKMVNASSEEKMIAAVNKVVTDKCISSAQVKSLGALFLSDDGRFNFFNAVYPYVYDAGSFGSLENQLIDPNYKKRFKALLK